MEIAEYLSDQNANVYWDFVEGLGGLETPINEIETESKKYNVALRIVQGLLTPPHVALMKLSVAMHTLTPRIQAHLQISKEILGEKDCDEGNFVQIGENVYCSLSELKQALPVPKPSTVEVFSFDHVYPGTENNTNCVVLYSDIGSKQFQTYHNYLKENAAKFDIKYVSRHYIKAYSKQKVGLSGYGVELHLKSTEYKSQDDSPQQSDDAAKTGNDDDEPEVEGFDFKVLKSRLPNLAHSLDRFRSALLEKSEEIAPLKAWEFQDLGLQAAQRIAEIQGDEALQVLQFIAQNFPSQAKSLLAQKVSDDFKKEMKHNIESLGRNLNLQPPDAALFVNGMFFDADTLDLVSLMDTLRTELDVLSGLHDIGLKGSITANLLALDLSMSSQKEFAIDIRDSAINWINDLESDSQYRRWPTSVMDLLRPTFPGMLRNVRKNLFNLVLVVDPIGTEARPLLKLAESFIVHMAPIRLGLVFDTRAENDDTKDAYRGIVCAFNYMMQHQSPRSAIGFLTDIYSSVKPTKDVTVLDIKSEMKKSMKSLSAKEIESIIGEDSEYDYGFQLAREFIDRLGYEHSPQALMNGVPLQESLLKADDFEEAVLTEIMQQTPIIQKNVYKGELADSDNVMDFLMSQPHVMPRLNQRILSTEEPIIVDLSGKPRSDIKNVNALFQLSIRDMTATVLDNIKYFVSKSALDKPTDQELHYMTLWVFGDLETANGRTLLRNALDYMKSNNDIRVAFIPNTEGLEVAEKNNLNRLVWAASQALNPQEATFLVLKWLRNPNKDSFNIPDAVTELLPSTELHIKMLRVYSQRVMKLKKSENMVVANGRCYGPLTDAEIFKTEDFGLLDRFHSHHYIDKIKKTLRSELGDEDSTITSDTILKLITTLVPRQQSRSRFTIPTDLQDFHSAVKLPPKNEDMPHFYIVAVLDPASKSAQKLASILILLRQVINCDMKVFLCAVEQHSDMPVKNFYRFVIEPEIRFTPDGKVADGPYAKFTGLPASPLLTQNLQVPENWLVEVVRSVYDLDNIKLIDIGGPVHSEYELEYLLLEGHCFDATTGAPPRGLQITLGTHHQPVVVDTIVMANLGYFQLKANPGAWDLRLRQGKSADIYDITHADGVNTIHKENSTRVVISSLRSHVIKLRVTKKPNMMNADLLGDDNESQSGIWDSITSSFSGSSSESAEVINIFSLASGHLYERLMRIMMLSLIKHTKSPVKFWFLKNYLSPQFIDFLPHMSKEYGFDFELVQYKWPRWLHQQTEKQRTIWGYKILFLDVLFPLDVKKIIFVDADAIVRADMKDLNELELNGAPYAYTPFCDSRKEMEGFRFWKQGYWRNHLMGRRYHISALYVVDLKRFRKIAAGDRLRGQYQALSQDPNSLSNLDQDLPNNMIHQVSIKSLPDEWLWCETWCSTESLKKAKVIDLCNNPMTKEAKLTAAQRIVPEWKEYDLEIKKLMAKVEDHEMENDSSSREQSSSEEEARHSEL